MAEPKNDRWALSRRQLVRGGAALGLLAEPIGPGFGHGRAKAKADPLIREYRAQTTWAPEPPAPHGMKTGLAPLSPARLWYLDSGGGGEPVVMLHAQTGSGQGWAYQLEALTRQGYRVIAYSRRGHAGSDRGPDDPGSMVDDLDALADYLKLDRFHLVGTALGGYGVSDYAISHPRRLRSITLASSLAAIDEPEFLAASTRLTPAEFTALPVELKELGPSYRAANPPGRARWIALEQQSKSGKPLPRQAKANVISWDALRALPMPVLVMTGDADLYFPPALLRLVTQRLPHWHAAIIAEAGHAAYWEQPVAFNAALIDFLAGARRGI